MAEDKIEYLLESKNTPSENTVKRFLAPALLLQDRAIYCGFSAFPTHILPLALPWGCVLLMVHAPFSAKITGRAALPSLRAVCAAAGAEMKIKLALSLFLFHEVWWCRSVVLRLFCCVCAFFPPSDPGDAWCCWWVSSGTPSVRERECVKIFVSVVCAVTVVRCDISSAPPNIVSEACARHNTLLYTEKTWSRVRCLW